MPNSKINNFIKALYSDSFDTHISLPDITDEVLKPVFHWHKRYVFEGILVLLALAGIVIGSFLLEIRQILFLSFLAILVILVFFFLLFENRRIKPRELAVVASLIAITVAARSAFYMLPQFKPVGALVIVSGAILGPEIGFIVGSMSMLVSNIFFTQGPWTPWQMIAFGLIGFVSGLLVQGQLMKPNRIQLSVFGFLSIFIIYGGIMNPASVLMFTTEVNVKVLLLSYVSGAPMDLVHALGTVIFLWLLAKPIVQKLTRIQDLLE